LQKKYSCDFGVLMSRDFRSFLRFVRYLFVGVGATLLHLSLFFVLSVGFSWSVFSANALAYVCAFSFSFCANYFWVFREYIDVARASFRFLCVSLLCFSINTALLKLAALGGHANLPLVVMCLAGLMPILSNGLSRAWVFR